MTHIHSLTSYNIEQRKEGRKKRRKEERKKERKKEIILERKEERQIISTYGRKKRNGKYRRQNRIFAIMEGKMHTSIHVTMHQKTKVVQKAPSASRL